MASRTLEEVYATRIEVANDKFLRRYSPVGSFSVDAIDGSKSNVAVSRELTRMRLAMLYMITGDLDRAEAMTAELINAVVAAELRRKIATRRKAGAEPA
jgi:hypothetical protein